jgi:hypothetical protein
MSRLALSFGFAALLASGAALAQSVFPQEQASNEVFQQGVIYTGTFCQLPTDSSYETTFFFRLTRFLKDGWLEVEIGHPYPEQRAFGVRRGSAYGVEIAPPRLRRINPAQLCWIEPYEEPK